jgi:ABC-2 type transport system permease protein
MNFGRIWAVVLRYFYSFWKFDSVCDIFYWPALDIFLWGITSVWIQQQQGSVPDLALAILTGLVFWQLIWRGNYEVTINLLLEFWNRNLVNLFSTPLRLSEWITSVMLVGLAKILVHVVFSAGIVYLAYALNIFDVGWAFLPFCVSLMLSGWFIGFISAAVIVYYGQRLQMLAWMTAYLFSPFSAVYYPVSALPLWAQKIAYCLPMTYIFEGMRDILYHQHFSLSMLMMSLVLNLVYLALSLLFFVFMYEKSRTKGLARLE